MQSYSFNTSHLRTPLDSIGQKSYLSEPGNGVSINSNMRSYNCNVVTKKTNAFLELPGKRKYSFSPLRLKKIICLQKVTLFQRRPQYFTGWLLILVTLDHLSSAGDLLQDFNCFQISTVNKIIKYGNTRHSVFIFLYANIPTPVDWEWHQAKVLAILLFTSRTMNIYITCYKKKIKKDFNCQESG